MKTIFIWKNILKVVLICLLASILAGILDNILELTDQFSILLGIGTGFLSVQLSLIKYKCWKFEF